MRARASPRLPVTRAQSRRARLRCRRARNRREWVPSLFREKETRDEPKTGFDASARDHSRAPAAPAAGQTGVVDMTGAKERFARAKAGIGEPPKGAMDGIKKVRAMGTQTVPFS